MSSKPKPRQVKVTPPCTDCGKPSVVRLVSLDADGKPQDGAALCLRCAEVQIMEDMLPAGGLPAIARLSALEASRVFDEGHDDPVMRLVRDAEAVDADDEKAADWTKQIERDLAHINGAEDDCDQTG